jgi:PAS domain S-box-containing protein
MSFARKHQNAADAQNEFDRFLSQGEELQRHLFHVFTYIALIFLIVYMVLQAQAGLFGLAALYALAAVIIAVNRWMIWYHNKLEIAANVFASLGPVVLLPWQITGGLAGTGLMWFPAYVVFVMFFAPGKWGSFWVMVTYGASFFLLLLQLQGILPFPFNRDVMFHFYFLGGVVYALTFLFLQAQNIIIEVLQLRVASLQSSGELAQTGTWSWDLIRDEVQWSDELYRIFGMRPSTKITFKAYMRWVHPDDRKITNQTVEEARRDHEPFSLIHRVRRPDGSVIWVHSLGEVLLNAAGDAVRMTGTTQDITNRLAKEAELLQKLHHE